MPEPLTLSSAAIGTVALTEGVKFLYQQAGEILKNWRTRRETAPAAPEPAAVVLPPVFEGQLTAPAIHYDVVSQVEPELRSLYKDLSEYAAEIEPIDDAAVAKVAALRQALALADDEAFYTITWAKDPPVHVLATVKIPGTPSAGTHKDE